MTSYWLFKSEPQVFSWTDLQNKGEAGEPWDGVRNFQARNFMKDMEPGDLGFFYHSQTEKAIVGILEVIEKAQQDPKTEDPRWVCVTVKARSPLPRPITLQEIKTIPQCQTMALVRLSRLSVQPVEAHHWDLLLKRSNQPNGISSI